MKSDCDVLIAWLRDAHAMETGLIPVLENHAKDAQSNPDASARIQQHIAETRRHAQLVEGCLKSLGSDTSGTKDILGKKRNKEIVLPRQVAMFLAREMGQMSYPDIGRAFGRDYTTVIHSYEKIKSESKRDSSLKNAISEIRSKAHARG